MDISDMAGLYSLIFGTSFVDRIERHGNFDQLLAVGGGFIGHGLSRSQ